MKKLGLAIFLIVIACSDFNLGYMPGGEPRPPDVVWDTLVDTLVVPSDSVIIYARYPFRDTVAKKSLSLRAGNYFSIQINATWSSKVDSLHLYGILVANDSLRVKVASGAVAKDPDSLTETIAGNQYRYNFYHAYPQKSLMEFKWENQSTGDIDVDFLVMLGCSSHDSDLVVKKEFEVWEVRDIAKRQSYPIQNGMFVWKKVAVIPDDSLWGTIQMPQGINAYILDESQMEELFEFGEIIAPIWNASDETSQLALHIKEQDTLYYVLHNSLDSAVQVSDTVLMTHLW